MTFFLNYLLPFVVALTILVFIHELGHYLPARRYGVKIDVFSIGFGPELFGYTDKAGTRWKFSLIPLGGYVKMFGDANAASAPASDALKGMSKGDFEKTLHSKSALQRMVISFGGPFANFLFAIIAMIFLFAIKGHPVIPSKVMHVKADTVAAEIGLKANDEIVEFNHIPTKDFKELRQQILSFEGKELSLAVKREGDEKPITLSLIKAEPFAKPFQLGIVPSSPVFEQKGLGESVLASFTTTYQLSADIVKSVAQAIAGERKAGDFGGILAIGEMAGKTAQVSFATFVWFLILLSVNLGLLNLFPLPVLDGGAIVFCFVEAIIGRPVPHEVQEALYLVGFGVIMLLIMFVTWNDLVRFGIVSKIVSLLGFGG